MFSHRFAEMSEARQQRIFQLEQELETLKAPGTIQITDSKQKELSKTLELEHSSTDVDESASATENELVEKSRYIVKLETDLEAVKKEMEAVRMEAQTLALQRDEFKVELLGRKCFSYYAKIKRIFYSGKVQNVREGR